jgi:hypothetical protein
MPNAKGDTCTGFSPPLWNSQDGQDRVSFLIKHVMPDPCKAVAQKRLDEFGFIEGIEIFRFHRGTLSATDIPVKAARSPESQRDCQT